MQSFFISLGNLIQTIWEYIQTTINNFFGLFETLGDLLEFVNDCLGKLPMIIKAPCATILTIMVIKFVLNLGKN